MGEFGEKDDETALNIGKIPGKKVAIALKEQENKRRAPRIAASGRGVLAEKILQLAYENGIKVRQDSDLAELLAKIEIDSPIPTEAFAAVAEILAYLYRANGQANPFDAVFEDAKDEE
ncbi:MAG: EscU/YscU/HrcU family type III secretion system export apparatus switch protein [Alphaproteobacteria bacterium]|nr:EscU/YscU/HrcU family type III secretion system export apparatus switch protein [Alphaproteobacteria bacterium]MCD8519816.1 EscU/YscU/HrcU family type III secretion system export apparatus switch protein [Alphaproteobacteria bacterium]MCD8570280.1 EscU/YscU/HrcU family type III secretion system export apparatus switch protein [Alphaproteobacteria bacterium]